MPIALITLAACAFSAQATERVFNDAQGDGNYDDARNWAGGAVPNGAIAVINGGRTAKLSTNVFSTTSELAELWVGNAGSPGYLRILKGGRVAVNGWLCVARFGGTSGLGTSGSTLTISGGEIMKYGDGKFVIADCNGVVGYVKQTGGDVTISTLGDSMLLANSTGTTAVYTMTGGTLTVASNYLVGAKGDGTMIQTAGEATVNGWLSLGRYKGGKGLYNLGGGTLTAFGTPSICVGEEGKGTFNLRGGVAKIGGVHLAQYPTAAGSEFNMTGGTLHVLSNTGIYQDHAGAFNISGGLLNMNGHDIKPLKAFRFSGGTILNAGKIAFSLVQSGGVLAPGNSAMVHTTTISGDYIQKAAGTLAIDILDIARYDTLVATGAAHFAGVIRVDLTNRRSVRLGDAFNIVNAASIDAGGLTWDLPALSNGLGWDTSSFRKNGSIRVVEEPTSDMFLHTGEPDPAGPRKVESQ